MDWVFYFFGFLFFFKKEAVLPDVGGLHQTYGGPELKEQKAKGEEAFALLFHFELELKWFILTQSLGLARVPASAPLVLRPWDSCCVRYHCCSLTQLLLLPGCESLTFPAP